MSVELIAGLLMLGTGLVTAGSAVLGGHRLDRHHPARRVNTAPRPARARRALTAGRRATLRGLGAVGERAGDWLVMLHPAGIGVGCGGGTAIAAITSGPLSLGAVVAAAVTGAVLAAALIGVRAAIIRHRRPAPTAEWLRQAAYWDGQGCPATAAIYRQWAADAGELPELPPAPEAPQLPCHRGCHNPDECSPVTDPDTGEVLAWHHRHRGGGYTLWAPDHTHAVAGGGELG